jgi:hypothetical protein
MVYGDVGEKKHAENSRASATIPMHPCYPNASPQNTVLIPNAVLKVINHINV